MFYFLASLECKLHKGETVSVLRIAVSSKSKTGSAPGVYMYSECVDEKKMQKKKKAFFLNAFLEEEKRKLLK